MPVTAVDINALRTGVIARLQSKVTGYAVEDFPDKPENYRLLNKVGAFLVAYRGADYAPSSDTGSIVQRREMFIDVVSMCNDLAGAAGDAAGGVYAMLELARTALVGYQLPGFSKLSSARERFTARAQSVWIYTSVFHASALAIESDDAVPDLDGAPLSHLTLVSPFTTSEIPNA